MGIVVTSETLALILEICAGFCREMNALFEEPITGHVALDDIFDTVEKLYNVKIEVISVPVESQHVHGIFELWPDTIQILVDSEKSESTRRYIIVKEIVHRIIWTEESATRDPSVLIDLIVQQNLFPGNGSNIPKDIEAEGGALFGAIEILFPMELRYKAKARLVQEEGVTTFKIAEELKIPSYIVEFALSDRYMSVCQKVHGDED